MTGNYSIATAILVAAPIAAQDWVNATPITSPAPTTFVRMAYDAGRNVSVAFGGWDAPVGATVFRDTWEYDGTNWTQANPATIPTERCEHMMGYDWVNGNVVMFGGQDFNFTLLPETLVYDGTDWTDVTPIGPSPAPRIDGEMAFDLTNSDLVLFGGFDGAAELNDTWTWDGAAWTQETPAASPSPRSQHTMCFDVARGVTVLFGGFDGTNNLNETWEYDGTTWTQVTTANAPSARVSHRMVFDQSRNVTVLFGGDDGTIVYDDTWEYDGTEWYRAFPTVVPPANAAHAMTYDLLNSQCIVFGGFVGAAASGDTWEFGGATATYRTFGAGCATSAGEVPTLIPQNVPTIGTTFNLDVTNLVMGPGNVFVTLAPPSGALPPPIDLSLAGITGCTLFVPVPVSSAVPYTATTATFSLAIPNSAGLVGLNFYNTAVLSDPAVARPFPLTLANAGEGTMR